MQIVIPFDFAVSDTTDGNANYKDLKDVADQDIILDIGPRTIEEINKIIDVSKQFSGTGSRYLKIKIGKRNNFISWKNSSNTRLKSLISIVGGGDTISAIKNNAIDVNFTHLSTAGGAFLEYIEGKNLPGVEVLK